MVEIAVLDAATGDVLLDTLVNPGCPVQPAARWVHSIGDDQLAASPPLAEVWPRLLEATAGRTVLAYNPFTSQADCRERVCREQIPLGSVPGVLTARLSGHRIMINGHTLSPPLSFVAAIPVGPEPRSRWSTRSEVRTTDWTVGGRLTRPPRSRNVADRRATAAHVPAVTCGIGRPDGVPPGPLRTGHYVARAGEGRPARRPACASRPWTRRPATAATRPASQARSPGRPGGRSWPR